VWRTRPDLVKSAASTHSLGEPLASSQRAIPVAKPPKLAGAKVEAWASPSEGFVRLANMQIWQRIFLWAQVPLVPILGLARRTILLA
jgi:hypothetical protein